MADEPDNLVHIYLRRIDERLVGLEREFMLRMTGLEARMGSLEARFSGLEGRWAALEVRADTICPRLHRIQRRLVLVHSPVLCQPGVPHHGPVACRLRGQICH